MGWSIAAEAVQVVGGYFDGVIWRWRLEDDAGEPRDVYVGISSAALALAPEMLPAATATATALRTRGRELVEEVARWPQPPTTIHVGRWSEQPSYADGFTRTVAGDGVS